MRRRKPDIVFTEPVKHHRSPRQALYNSARRRNVKRTFGLAAMLVGIFALLIFVFPLFDVPIGILGLVLGFVAYNIKTDGKDVGHHMATVGMLCSAFSLVLAVAFWFVGERKQQEQKLTAEEQRLKLVESLTGVWRANDDSNISLEFTPAGNLIFSELESGAEDAEALRETAGLYHVSPNAMTVSFGSRSTKFTWEILPSSELRIMAPSDRDIRLDLDGKWRKVRTLTLGIDLANASPEVKKYFEQLDDYTSRKKTLIRSLVKYTQDKDSCVKKLNELKEADKKGSAEWQVRGRELKSLTEQIELITDRIGRIDTVIVRLQAIIRNEGRNEDIARLNMSEDELVKLLETNIRLEDHLKPDNEVELVTDMEVEELIKANERDSSVGADPVSNEK